MLIRVGEPVVARTNHGSARNVICEPSDETTCDASSAPMPRARRTLTPPPRGVAAVRSLARRTTKLETATRRHRDGLHGGERDEHGLRAERVEHRADAEDAERLGEPEDHHVHGHHARPERRRHAQGHERVDRRVDEPVRDAREAERDAASEPGVRVERQEPERQRLAEDARGDERQPADALEQEPVGDDVARATAPTPNDGEQPARDRAGRRRSG